LACFGFGLRVGDLPDGEGMALPVVKELAIPTFTLLLERGHFSAILLHLLAI
jgi:hypothetical protein